MNTDKKMRKLIVGYGIFLCLTGLRDSDELFESFKKNNGDKGGIVTYKGKRYIGLSHVQQMTQDARFNKGAK